MPRYAAIVGLFELLNVSASAYNIVENEQYDGELDQIVAQAQTVRGDTDAAIKTADELVFVSMVRTYLSHFVPDETALNLGTIGVIYLKILNDSAFAPPPPPPPPTIPLS